MPIISESELGRMVKQNELTPVYFLYGKETYLSYGYLQRLIEKAVQKGTESFNYQKFDGASPDFVSMQVAVDGMPMMGGRKCVVFWNPNLEKLKKDDMDALLSMVKDPNPSTVFIIFVDGYDLNPKKMAKIRKFIDEVAKTGCVVEFSPRTQAELTKFLKTRFQKAGITIETTVVSYFIERCGASLDLLAAEADKLIAYKETGEITRADVSSVTHRSLEASVFDLSKRMLANDYTRAFGVLEELFSMREEPLAILGALNAAFLDLYRAKAAMLASKTAEDVASVFPSYRGKEFRIRNAFRDVGKYSAQTLRGCLSVLSQADVRLKSTRCDDKACVEQVIGEILNLSGGGRRQTL